MKPFAPLLWPSEIFTSGHKEVQGRKSCSLRGVQELEATYMTIGKAMVK